MLKLELKFFGVFAYDVDTDCLLGWEQKTPGLFVCYFEFVGNWSCDFLSRTVDEGIGRNRFVVEVNVGPGVGPRIAASSIVPAKGR